MHFNVQLLDLHIQHLSYEKNEQKYVNFRICESKTISKAFRHRNLPLNKLQNVQVNLLFSGKLADKIHTLGTEMMNYY